MNKSYDYLIGGGTKDLYGQQIENLNMLKKYLIYDVSINDKKQNKNFNLNIPNSFTTDDNLKDGTNTIKCSLLLNKENTSFLLDYLNYTFYIIKLNFLEKIIYKQISYYEDIDTLLFNMRSEIYNILKSNNYDIYLLIQEQIFNEDILKHIEKSANENIKPIIKKYQIELIKLKNDKLAEIKEIIDDYKNIKFSNIYFKDLCIYVNDKNKIISNQIDNIIKTYSVNVNITNEDIKFNDEYIKLKSATQEKIINIRKSDLSENEKNKQITALRNKDNEMTKEYLRITNNFRIYRIKKVFNDDIMYFISIIKKFRKSIITCDEENIFIEEKIINRKKIINKKNIINGVYISNKLFKSNIFSLCSIIGINIKKHELIIKYNNDINFVNIEKLCINIESDFNFLNN